jgi:hypothetical protein
VTRRSAVLSRFRPPPAPVKPPVEEAPSGPVVVAGLPLVHVAGCPILRGLEARPATGAEVGADLRRCGICSTP